MTPRHKIAPQILFSGARLCMERAVRESRAPLRGGWAHLVPRPPGAQASLEVGYVSPCCLRLKFVSAAVPRNFVCCRFMSSGLYCSVLIASVRESVNVGCAVRLYPCRMSSSCSQPRVSSCVQQRCFRHTLLFCRVVLVVAGATLLLIVLAASPSSIFCRRCLSFGLCPFVFCLRAGPALANHIDRSLDGIKLFFRKNRHSLGLTIFSASPCGAAATLS